MGADSAINLLRELFAEGEPDGGRKLFDFLLRSFRLLSSWNNPTEICLAALFQNIYQPQIFNSQHDTICNRARIKTVVGDEAESLAFLLNSVERPKALFNAIDSSTLIHRTHPTPQTIDVTTLKALLEIECATLIAQGAAAVRKYQSWYEVIMQKRLISYAAQFALLDCLQAKDEAEIEQQIEQDIKSTEGLAPSLVNGKIIFPKE